MGVMLKHSTLEGGVTPICNDCGVTLCWDISEEEYYQRKLFWDRWRCRECNPEYRDKQRKDPADEQA